MKKTEPINSHNNSEPLSGQVVTSDAHDSMMGTYQHKCVKGNQMWNFI